MFRPAVPVAVHMTSDGELPASPLRPMLQRRGQRVSWQSASQHASYPRRAPDRRREVEECASRNGADSTQDNSFRSPTRMALRRCKVSEAAVATRRSWRGYCNLENCDCDRTHLATSEVRVRDSSRTFWRVRVHTGWGSRERQAVFSARPCAAVPIVLYAARERAPAIEGYIPAAGACSTCLVAVPIAWPSQT